MKVTYLAHSGFAVETERHRLVFDCFRGEPLTGGGDDGKATVFFVSHFHEDHYNRNIYAYAKRSDTFYVLSREVRGAPPEASVTFMRPYEEAEIAGIRIRTLRSTDCGVAYLVDVDGETVYHAGDLHLWVWDGAPADSNRAVEGRFLREIEKLRGTEIDAAFLPLDPRQQEDGVRGFDITMRTLSIKHAFPMHFWGDGGYVDAFCASPTAEPYRDRVIPLTHEGESVEI